MFGGPDGLRRIMSQDNIKPQNLSDTLARFGRYFRPYWPMLAVTLLLIIGATWSQVTAPMLIGQTVDCYLTLPSRTALAPRPKTTVGMTRTRLTYPPKSVWPA